jgi:hypothetical protein
MFGDCCTEVTLYIHSDENRLLNFCNLFFIYLYIIYKLGAGLAQSV